VSVTTYEEWRVTGNPGDGYEPYRFTFSPQRGDADPETVACNFVRLIHKGDRPWTDGPHLHRRTVTVTDWEAIEP
jgi:hypothetical protein